MIDSFGCTVSAGVHPPDPFHLVAGFQRFRNALSICHLFYQPKKKLLRLPVNIRKIGVQFTAGQQVGIVHTVMLLEIAEMPLPPYPDWRISLRLIIPGNQIIVSNQLILQARAFISTLRLVGYRARRKYLFPLELPLAFQTLESIRALLRVILEQPSK